MSGAAGAAAAAAAAKRREALRLEEEQETTPMTTDPQFEYKIMRTAWGTFENRARLQSVLDQEAPAGWDLCEKLDERRLRLRRPVECREQDADRAQDPYRIWVGPSENALGLLVVASIVMMMVVGLIVATVMH